MPLFKPPYKRVSPMDLNTSEQAWVQPHGDGPRFHPALRALELPPLRGACGTSSRPLLTPTPLTVNPGRRTFESAPDDALVQATGDPTGHAALLLPASTRIISAYDKKTGEHLGPGRCARRRAATR